MDCRRYSMQWRKCQCQSSGKKCSGNGVVVFMTTPLNIFPIINCALLETGVRSTHWVITHHTMELVRHGCGEEGLARLAPSRAG